MQLLHGSIHHNGVVGFQLRVGESEGSARSIINVTPVHIDDFPSITIDIVCWARDLGGVSRRC